MKKKFVSFLIVLMMVLSCGILSACKNRYNNMQFVVEYAFKDENGAIDQWYTIGQNLSLNFGAEDDKLDVGRNNLVFRVEVKNVKAKYIDDIVIFDSNSSSSQIVKQGQEFSLDVDGVMQTSVRIYETKSGKEKSFRLNIFESLKNITTNKDFKPALAVGQSVNLNLLTTANQNRSVLLFNPVGTNQTAVDYSIVGLGYYNGTTWVQTRSADEASNVVGLANDVVTITDTYDAFTNPILKIKATSKIYNDPENEISTTFDIYVIEKLTVGDSPVISQNGEQIKSKILYVNDDENNEYKTIIDVGVGTITSKYIAGVTTANGDVAKYGLNVYVDGVKVEMDAYDDHNGIRIQPMDTSDDPNNEKQNFVYEITADDKTYLTYPKNTIKFELTVLGLDYVVETPLYSADLEIEKRSIVKNVTLNGKTSQTLTEGKIYATANSSVSQSGLYLTVDVLPNDGALHNVLIAVTNGLTVTGRGLESITSYPTINSANRDNYTYYSVKNGTTILVNFKANGNTANQELRFTTLKKGEDGVAAGYVDDYVLPITKVVTANSFEVLSARTGSVNYIDQTYLVDAEQETVFFLKVRYTGDNLALDTIDLSLPVDSGFTFKNGRTSINVKNDFASAGISLAEGRTKVDSTTNEYYEIYQIPLRPTNAVGSALVSISAGKTGNYALFEGCFTIKSVFVAQSDNFTIQTEGQNITKITDLTSLEFDKFAVVNNINLKSEISFGQINPNGQFEQKTVANVRLTKSGKEGNANFSASAVDYLTIGRADSANKFQIWGIQGGKTTHFVATITHYTRDGGVITEKQQSLEFEVAAYNNINNIELAFNSANAGKIVYINSNYPDAASTNVVFNAKSELSEPSASISFGMNSGETQNKTGINKVKIGIFGDDTCVDVYLNTDDGLKLLKNNQIIDKLSGNVVVKLVKTPEQSLRYVGLSFTALSFDQETSVSRSITINFGDYTPSSKIELEGNSLKKENGDISINMSFMNVPDGGQATTNFNATVTYDNQSATISRYDDLDYQLYQIMIDDQGNPIKRNDKYQTIELSKAANRLGININKNNGKSEVGVSANKALGGGMFILRLVAQDSYNELTGKYENFVEIFISIADGSNTAKYKISSVDDFNNIANNLNAHYVLTNDIVIKNHKTFESFSGSISGKDIKYSSNGNITETIRKLTITIANGSTETDNVYYGIFERLTGEASISDLTLDIRFADITPNLTDPSKAVYIGGLAGVIDTNVKIENVKFIVNVNNINLQQNVNNRPNLTTDVFVGGVAGEMAGSIDLNNSPVTISGNIKTSFAVIDKNIYFGGVAGRLLGNISGNYTQPSDLKGVVYNIGLNVHFIQAENNVTATNVIVGGVAGVAENANISGIIIMGQIEIASTLSLANGFGAGLVGQATNSQIKDIVLLGVNIYAGSPNLNLAGVAGKTLGSGTEKTIINNVKFIGFRIEEGIENGLTLNPDNYGLISNINSSNNGVGTVAGVVAQMCNNSTITLCSVENFADADMLVGEQVFGLAQVVDSAENVEISLSYVNANILAGATKQSSLLANIATSNSYYIGKFVGSRNAGIAGANNYIFVLDGNGNVNYATSPADSDITVVLDNYSKDTVNQIDAVSGEKWAISTTKNLVKVGEYTFCLPYLTENFTLIPTDILTNLNQTKLEEIKSLYSDADTSAEDNVLKAYKITETAIINYFNDIKNPLKNADNNTYKIADLVDITVVPDNAIGTVVYKILHGAEYASIVNGDSIYFKGVSNRDYILVKAYSLFNPDACDYFLFYTQTWFSDIELDGGSLQKVDSNIYQLETHKGFEDIEIDVLTSNVKQGDATTYSSLFDVDNIREFVEFETSVTNLNTTETGHATKIEQISSMFNRLTISSTNNDFADGEKQERIVIKVKFNLTAYLGSVVCPQVDGVDKYIDLATLTVNVNISETATGLEFTTDHLEGESKENFAFNATLHTGYVGSSIDTPEDNKHIETNLNNNIVEFVEPDHDSLLMSFSVLDGQDEFNRLLAQAKVSTIPELFDIDVFNSFNNANKTFNYSIALQLKDSYNTRYLTAPISFAIKVFAKSNPNVDGDSAINLVIKPSSLSTSIIINNYAASSEQTKDNYTHLITSSQVETATITPGGNGGVLAIRMQPSYAYVGRVTLSSSQLFVPSLNDNVTARFEQLVYHTKLDSYIGITPSCEQTADGLGVILKLASQTENGVEYTFDGTIYVHVVLDKKFSGLADEIRLTLDVENTDGTHIVKTKSLVTDFLPGVELDYDNQYLVGTGDTKGYLIQQNTTNNIVTLKIYGYQFNANPSVTIAWANENDTDNDNNHLADIDYMWLDKYSDLKPNADGSYTMRMSVAVREKITQPFKISVNMSLISNNEIKTDGSDITFYPTDYLLNNKQAKFEFGSKLNLALNQSRDLTFNFVTNNTNIDYSTEIYLKLLADFANKSVEEFKNMSTTEKADVVKKLLAKFTYMEGDVSKNFADTSEYFELYTTNYGSGSENITYMRLKANGKFETSVKFKVFYTYEKQAGGNYALKFGEDTTYPYVLEIAFDMQFYTATTRQQAFAISSAEQMFDSNGNSLLGEGQNYVLTNDIVVELAKPITTKIASLDGNNKKIIIKNFAVDSSSSSSETAGYYGLFATVDESTLLYNIVVDYSQFNTGKSGQLVLAYENITSVVFGGLTAVNNGLIYNCDVVNAGNASKIINILVNNNADTSITFGGLVGINNGTITNSRVGRSEFTKIIANDNSQTSYTEFFKPLEFIVGNRTIEQGQGFKSLIGGLVGVNNSGKTISSSYVANTSLYTYSTNQDSKLAGFVADNSGKISYSYVKGLESTITSENVYATGSKVEAYADGNIAGFVYDNNSGANINNSFANIELVSKSAFMAGFVFNNNSGASIAQCYASCTFTNTNSDTSLQITPEQPFVGADTTGLHSLGTLENCFWYKDNDPNRQFILFEDDTKPQATGLNATNFADTTNLVNFVFVLSNSKNDRDEGIWSFYNNQGNVVKLPELTIANNVAHSFRYESGNASEESGLDKYTYATKFSLGSKANPEIISSVQEFNDVFTSYGTSTTFSGYVRFINDIDFASDKAAIQTRRGFVLGGERSSTNVVADSYTSVDGNGMSISNIYLDVGEDSEKSVGLFAEINRAYIKNLNLSFSSGNFSTANSVYSGGLAGRVSDSVIINISLDGASTTIQGANIVGGLAGLIEGQSLIYGVSSNLSVNTTNGDTTELYNSTKHANDTNYATRLSYAGGIVGIADLTARAYSKEAFNLSYLYINENAVDKNQTLNIVADFAGGVAGYVGKEVKALRLSYNIGTNNRIKGQYSAGGLFGASVGASVEASKVSASDTDTEQFAYDQSFADYVVNGLTDLQLGEKYNAGLIESYQYGGGLIGMGIGSTVFSCYSKASFYAGVNIGGLIGLDVLSTLNFNYSVPYLNFNGNMEELKTVGGYIGVAGNASTPTYGQIYSSLGSISGGISYAFSTILINNAQYQTYVQTMKNQGINVDSQIFNNFIGSDYIDHIVFQAYVGNVDYTSVPTNINYTAGVAVKQMKDLFDLDTPDNQLATYNAIFSIWDTKYWNLDTYRHFFPLLTDQRDENYEIIKDANDFNKLKNNPTGSFKIVDDINMDTYIGGTNFVFDFTFKGVLVGEKPNGETPMVYNLHLAGTDKDDAGLFRATQGATFRNIEFSWKENGVGGTRAVEIKNFAGLVGTDTPSTESQINTKISAILVTVGKTPSTNNAKASELFAKSDKASTITGFAGLIYSATGTSILNSSFSGVVTATVKNEDSVSVVPHQLAGLIGIGQTDDTNTLGIVNSTVGDNQETVFNLTLQTTKQVNFGLIAGELTSTAVSGNIVGSLGSATSTNKIVVANIVLNGCNNAINLAGLVAVSENCTLSDNASYNKIVVSQTETDNSSARLNLAGLVGKYLLDKSDRVMTANKAKVYLESTANVGVTYASAGIATVETEQKVQIIQSVLTGDILVSGNSVVGAVVANADLGEEKSTTVLLDQVVANVNITPTLTTDATNADEISTITGGLVGNINGELILANTMNMGRIMPKSVSANVKYFVGGMAGKVNKVTINLDSYSYSLSSILAGGLSGQAIAQQLGQDGAEKADISNMGALFGYVDSVNINGQAYNTTATNKMELKGDIFYSTDLSLMPEDSLFGTNLTYTTLIGTESGYQQRAVETGLWTNTASNNTCVPYITSLYAPLRQLNILQTASNNYVSGLAANPKTNYVSTTENYYYLVSGLNLDSKFVGVAIGSSTISDLFINTIDENSALSNVHINYDNKAVTRPLVHVNLGVIYNCSINGVITSLTDTQNNNGSIGLIVNNNYGLLSHSFNSADITSKIKVGALAVANSDSGTISSSYFTGNITITDDSSSVYGFAFAETVNGYYFNNYSAGNITKVSSNSFGAVSMGVNNYVDPLATPVDGNIGETEQGQTNALMKATTYQLMSASILHGNWKSTLLETQMFDLTDASFGFNFNYPVYNFNQYTFISGSSIEPLSLNSYSRQTGNGVDKVFEVSHLGVLSSIQGIIANVNGANRSYKLIRDIDGTVNADGNVNWVAVGYSSTAISENMFAGSESGFTGTFDGTKAVEDNKVTEVYSISNIANNGLFANVGYNKEGKAIANIQNIAFKGNFDKFVQSGAIGTTIKGDVEITNIDISSLTISAATLAGSGVNKVAMLFASQISGSLSIIGLTTKNENAEQGATTNVATLQTGGAGYYASLLAELQLGNVEFNDEALYINFDDGTGSSIDNNVIGGLVGLISGNADSTEQQSVRSLYAGGQTDVNLTLTNHQIIGGLIGQVGNGFNSCDFVVSNFKVKFTRSTFTANQFGGLIGVVNSQIQIKSCIIENRDLNISFAQGENRYFGLVAAIINGGSLTYDDSGTAFEYSSKIMINADATTSSVSDFESSQGFGALVGKLTQDEASFVMKGQIATFAPTMVVVNACNVGGFVGYYGGGTISIAKPKLIKLQGTVNVGGAIGYANAKLKIDEESDINKYISVEKSSNTEAEANKFAELQSALTKSATNAMNWGGLIGKAGESCEINGLANFNAIKIQNNLVNSKISNVGGVVGYTMGKVNNCVNNASILVLDLYGQAPAVGTDFYNLYVSSETADMNQATVSIRPINVGGIAGKSDGEITSCTISEEVVVQGYESVGGIVGYTNSLVTGFKIVNTNDTTPSENVVYYENLDGSYKAVNTLTMQDGKPVYNQDGSLKYNNLDTFDINKTYYVMDSNAIVYGNVMGAYNVGGVVGCLDSAGSIAGYKVKANVYGNTNVGGVVGFAKNNTVVENNMVAATITTDDAGNTTKYYPTIKGIMVHDYVLISAVSDEGNSYYFIPTSVGGLIGSTVDSSGTAKGTRVANNIVLANITSTEEGVTPRTVKDENGNVDAAAIQGVNKGSNVISTISNFMLTSNSSSLALDDKAKNSIIYNGKTERKTKFNGIATGFGGLIGSTDSNTVLKNENLAFTIETNHITTSIDASLGINVGTYYGSYIIWASVQETTGNNSVEHKMVLPVLQAESNISGAYNIGGAIGYSEDKTQTGLSYHYAPAYQINIQTNGVGMYVGGVFGKFIGTIGNNSSQDPGKGLTVGGVSKTGSLNIVIHSDGSYFVGGLIGRLEGNMYNSSVVTKKADGGFTQNLAVNGNHVQNFGGLVGMLKVGARAGGSTVTVHGAHTFEFTVNTIENQNYADGEALFNSTISNSQIDLYAQAYYINLDTFNISSSLIVPADSPINGTSGWHKDYTAFRAIQRCIPASANGQIDENGKLQTAGWDSVTVIYDAGNIMSVGVDNENNITYTLYEEEPGVPKLYTKIGIAVVLLDEAGNNMTVETLTSKGDKANFPDETVMNLDDPYKKFAVLESFDQPIKPSIYDGHKYARYYYPLAYNGETYAFGFRTIYNSDSRPLTGSIFEVNGIAQTSVDMGEEYKEGQKTWSTILGWFGVALVIAAIIIPGCQWYLVVAGIVGATVGVVNFAMVEMYSNQLMQIRQSSINYMLATNQNRGFLASLNSREMRYDIDEDGNIVNISSSGYTYEDTELSKYYVKYSTIRPVDYYDKLYCEVTGKDSTGADITIDNSNVLEVIVKAESINQCVKPEGDINWNGRYGYLNNKAYFLNYLYKDGYYWKCALSGKIVYNRSNASLFYGLNPDAKEPLVYDNGLIYVYGKYDYDNDVYTYEKTYGNQLQYKNGSYTLEGKEIWGSAKNIENPVITIKDKQFIYDPNASDKIGQAGYNFIKGVYYTYNGKDISDLKGYANYSLLSNNTIQSNWVEGIDYVTANYMLASYSEYEGDLIVGQTYYKLESGTYNPFVVLDGVEYDKTNIYTRTTTEKKAVYVINSTTLEEYSSTLPQSTNLRSYASNDGAFENETQIPKIIQLQVKPYSFKNPYHRMVNNGLPKIKNETAMFTIAGENYNGSASIACDVNYYLWQGGYVYDSDNKKLYTAVEQSVIEDENKKIPVIPAKEIEKEKSYILKDINDNWSTYNSWYIFNGEQFVLVSNLYGKRRSALYLKSTNKDLSNTELQSKVILVKEPTTITYKFLQNNYEAYKDEYLAKDVKIGDVFKIDENNSHLCSLSQSYTLSNDNGFTGLLYQISFVMGDEGVVDYNYNMYLSNAKYGLYTRYKYLFADNTGDAGEGNDGIIGASDLAKRFWKFDNNNYSVVPKEDSTVVNNGRKTYFVERVMVTLSKSTYGGLSKIYLGKVSTSPVGKISISSYEFK